MTDNQAVLLIWLIVILWAYFSFVWIMVRWDEPAEKTKVAGKLDKAIGNVDKLIDEIRLERESRESRRGM